MKKIPPSFRLEKEYWDKDISIIIGIDEVGRGAFAGPITAAGVIYKPNFKHDLLSEIRDSKKLSAKKREKLSEFIKDNSTWDIKSVELDYINKYGIGRANQKVMRMVLSKLMPRNKDYFILIDGFDLQIPKQKGIIKGDNICLSIASASIIAKVHRDNIMKEYARKYPEYGFDQNKGYGTLYHREVIKLKGLSKLHRTSFNINNYAE